ncbi:ATP synthase F1 subunit epsilon [Mycoplasmopsis gallinacea]|uniref:ATP synthase epsilon chain n=1 Tax=Mycoplasmopsis gallinacea TaxID=29556 RepID=A0A449A2J2_9BACT|nr:ATP synthase F1 subunit epsilon [Mycoplasmopsis gallinacea]VEU58465.1 ATP synthase epsilon subunit [Mycoplasmopsis gallinacea]
MSKVYLNITTPTGIFYVGKVDIVTLKTAEGYIGLQSHRSPFFSNVEIGNLIIGHENDKDSIKCIIGGGLVYADSTKINIITDDIINVNDIDLSRAEADRDKYIKQIEESKQKDMNTAKLELKLKKALGRIDAYNTYHK